MCLNRMRYPVELAHLENMLKPKLHTVLALTSRLSLYNLDIDQGRVSQDYPRLRYMTNRHDECILIDKNVQPVTSSNAHQRYTNTTKNRHRSNSVYAGASMARQQGCRNWTKKGNFHKGDRSLFTHDEAKKGTTPRSSSRGKGNGE